MRRAGDTVCAEGDGTGFRFRQRNQFLQRIGRNRRMNVNAGGKNPGTWNRQTRNLRRNSKCSGLHFIPGSLSAAPFPW